MSESEEPVPGTSGSPLSAPDSGSPVPIPDSGSSVPIPDSGSSLSVSDNASIRSARVHLFVISMLCLFCELAVIRWLSTEIRIFSYFKNLPLTAALLGLGLGFLWTVHKRDYFKWTAALLICLSILLICAFNVGLTYMTFVDPSKFIVFGLENEHGGELLMTIGNLLIMLGIFALTAGIFVGFGQRMGLYFSKLKSLEAYSINVAGSLAGTLLFSALSWLSTPPSVWLVCAGVLFLILKRNLMHALVAVLGLVYGLFLATTLTQSIYHNDFVETCWSPYYRIDVVRVRQPSGPFAGSQLGYNININFDTFQSIVDCTEQSLKRLPPDAREAMLNQLSAPYRVLNKDHARILILGSGTGSDVAAALRNGADHVDAVEIDPQIVEIGRQLHPEHPYQSPRVSTYVMDARTFLKNSKSKYDLIVFAALDSHTAFSSLSSLRTDNYIFTKESLTEAAHLLNDTGLIFEQFVVPMDWLYDRHAATLEQATGMKPLGYYIKVGRGDLKQTGAVLFAGPKVKNSVATDFHIGLPPRAARNPGPVAITTDDWPFLFLPKQELPLLYILPLALVMLISTLPVASYIARGGSALLNWQMLFLGMGFMLLEVRAMAKISLFLGSTWVVNSLVISLVLILVLMANWLATKLKPSNIVWIGAALILSLILSQLVNASEFLKLGGSLGPVLAAALYLLPCVFASTIFALLFSQTRLSSAALAFNLIGAVYGVALEYASMAFGINALGVISISIYSIIVASFLLSRPVESTEAA